MSVLPKPLEELHAAVKAMDDLLSDPEPGTFSWNVTLVARAIQLHVILTKLGTEEARKEREADG